MLIGKIFRLYGYCILCMHTYWHTLHCLESVLTQFYIQECFKYASSIMDAANRELPQCCFVGVNEEWQGLPSDNITFLHRPSCNQGWCPQTSLSKVQQFRWKYGPHSSYKNIPHWMFFCNGQTLHYVDGHTKFVSLLNLWPSQLVLGLFLSGWAGAMTRVSSSLPLHISVSSAYIDFVAILSTTQDAEVKYHKSSSDLCRKFDSPTFVSKGNPLFP